MGSVVDVSEVLLEVGLSSSVTDEERAIVNTAITRAEGAVKRYLQYDPVQRLRTEFYPQRDFVYTARTALWESEGDLAVLNYEADIATNELQVQHLPIRDTPAIDLRIDFSGRSGTSGGFGTSSVKTEGTDFWPNYDGQDSSGNGI